MPLCCDIIQLVLQGLVAAGCALTLSMLPKVTHEATHGRVDLLDVGVPARDMQQHARPVLEASGHFKQRLCPSWT